MSAFPGKFVDQCGGFVGRAEKAGSEVAIFEYFCTAKMKLNTTEKNNDYEKIAYQLFRISIYIARRVDGIRAVGDRHVSSGLAGHGKLFQHNGFNGATGTHHQHDWPRRRTAHFRSAERQVRPPSASFGLDAGIHRFHPALHLLAEH